AGGQLRGERPMRKVFALGFVLIAWLGVAAAWTRTTGQSAPATGDAQPRPLDSEATVVRLLFGVGDAEPTPWKGKAAVDRGEIVAIEPWRFRAGSSVTGPGAWESRSLYLLKAPKAATKPKGVGKKGQARKAAIAKALAKDEHGGPAPAGASVVPTGVIV